METQEIRLLIELASRAPMSNYERRCFNRDSQIWLAALDQTEQDARTKLEAEKSKEEIPTG